MTTSQTYSFSPTVADIISDAMDILRIVQEGQQATPATIAKFRRGLEYILKRLSIQMVPIWSRYRVIVPIVANRNPYTVGAGLNIDIGPSSTVGNSRLPVNIYRIMYKYAASDGLEFELTPLGRSEYWQYALKASSGVPNSWYYEKLLDSGNLNLYPVPDNTSTGDYLYIDVQRYLYDAGIDTNTLDMPVEWCAHLKWALASEMLCNYEQPSQRTQLIVMKVKETYDIAMLGNGDTSSIWFLPDTRPDDPRW